MLRALLPSLLFCLPLTAQQLITVNQAGGADFETIAAAHGAALPGDTIFLQTGFYPAATISKGIRLIGSADVQLTNLEILGISAGETASVSNIRIRGSLEDGRIVVRDCLGSVHLDTVTGRCVLHGSGLACNGTIMMVENSSQVSMRDCAIIGRPAVTVSDSQLNINDCLLLGADAFQSGGVFPPGFVDGSPALIGVNSDVSIAQSSLTGGKGAPGIRLPDLPPGPGVDFNGGRLEISGGSILGGDPNGVPVFAEKIRTDGAVSVLLSGGLKCADAGIALPPGECSEVFLPSLRSTEFGPGGLLQITAFAPEDSLVCVHFGRPAPPMNFPFGSLWLAPSGIRVLGVGQVMLGEDRLQVSRSIPSTLLLGETFTLQSAVLAGGELSLSLPMTIVAH